MQHVILLPGILNIFFSFPCDSYVPYFWPTIYRRNWLSSQIYSVSKYWITSSILINFHPHIFIIIRVLYSALSFEGWNVFRQACYGTRETSVHVIFTFGTSNLPFRQNIVVQCATLPLRILEVPSHIHGPNIGYPSWGIHGFPHDHMIQNKQRKTCSHTTLCKWECVVK
jgi:hypothetical protein